MTGLELLQSVQFVTVKGKRVAVLSADDWEALIEWLETLEDMHVARSAFAELKVADGDRLLPASTASRQAIARNDPFTFRF